MMISFFVVFFFLLEAAKSIPVAETSQKNKVCSSKLPMAGGYTDRIVCNKIHGELPNIMTIGPTLLPFHLLYVSQGGKISNKGQNRSIEFLKNSHLDNITRM